MTRRVAGHVFVFHPHQWPCKIWRRTAFQDMVDLLSSSSTIPTLQQQEVEKKRVGSPNLRLPGFRGTERPSATDIHILCHVFQHVPWSPSLEKSLRQRNFGITAQQVTQGLHTLQQNLYHTLTFFIWASQQRGYSYSAEACEILRKTLEENLDHVDPLLRTMESQKRYIPLIVFTILMELYAEKNMVEEAVEIFKATFKFRCRPDEDAYNLVLEILVDSGKHDEAYAIFEQMQTDRWCRPGTTTFFIVLYSLGKSGRIGEAYKIMRSLKASDQVLDVEAYARLIEGLCAGGWLEQAEEVVIEMYELALEPDVHVYTSLISGHANIGNMEESHSYYTEAVNEKLLAPSQEIFLILITGFCKQDNVIRAFELFKEMMNAGFQPDVSLCSMMFQSICEHGEEQLVEDFWNGMAENGIDFDAEMIYDKMLESCVNGEQPGLALFILNDMVMKKCLCPNEVTFVALLNLLKEINQFDSWQRLLAIIENIKESSKPLVCRILVDYLINLDQDVAKYISETMEEKGMYKH